MSSVPQKTVTVKSDIWFIDSSVVHSIGYQESPLFGTEYTKFYLCAENRHEFYALYLYLAVCKEEKIQIDGKLLFGSKKSPTSESLFKGEISRVKTTKRLGIVSLRDSHYTLAELTFEEADVPKVTQQNLYEALSSQLLNLRENTNSADITLVSTVDGREFPAHKVILALRSPVFSAMFQHGDFVENKNKRVEIDDVKGEVMDALLKFIYSADVQGIEKIADELLQAADKYDIPLLVEVCAQSLLMNLTIDTAAKFFYLTDLYRLEEAKKSVIAFIAENRQAVSNSAGWKQFIGLEQLQQLYDSMPKTC